MNSAAAYTPTQVSGRPSAAPGTSYLVFTLCASLYLIPFMRIIMAGTDEGTLLCGALRIHNGQVFARDFFEVMGPGTFYWLAAFFKLFGVTVLASRICLFITSLGTGLAVYFLSRQICGKYRALPCLILVGTSFGFLWPGISHHVDSNFSALLAVVCLVLWQARPNNALLIAVGALAGITTCIHLPKGVFLFCAFAAWLWLQHRRISPPLARLGLLSAGSLVVVALVLLYFWSQGALGSLIYANVGFPSQNYGGANAVGYGFGILLYYWSPWVMSFGGGALAFAIAAILMVPMVFVAVLPLLVLVLGKPFRLMSMTPVIALYWLSGWAMWLAELHRKDIQHLAFGSPLLIVLCIHALTISPQKLADLSLQLLAICAVCLAGLNCAVILSAEAQSQTETRVGKVALHGMKAILVFLDQHTSPGEEVFIYPYGPTYYFLSGTSNPTRYSFLEYTYNTPAQFQEAVADLERKQVRYVIWDTNFAAMAEKNFPGSRPRNPKDLIVEPYLESHYNLIEKEDGVWMMERKAEYLAK